MRFISLTYAAAAVAAATSASTRNDTLVPFRFILEFPRGVNSSLAADQLRKQHGVRVVRTFTSDVFTGVSVETSELSLEALQAIAEVHNAWPVRHVPLFQPSPNVTIPDSAEAAEYNVHSATGVDKLHAAGVYGEGAVVGVIDTGVWYSHPALGGGIGPQYKVIGGYDLVGDGAWPNADPEPDSDPLDHIGHGTHVSGIIIGQTDDWVGVAPKAKLRMYKVFSELDGTTEDMIIAGFLMAFNDGVDVITASVGTTGGFSDDPWAVIASRIVDAGVVVTIAAGNSGIDGPFYASSGSSGANVLAVASAEGSQFPATPFAANFTTRDGDTNQTILGYIPSTYAFPDGTTIPIVVLNFNTSDPADACDPLPASTGNLSQVIPLVRRGTCTFGTKQANLEEFGAQYILFYNNDSPIVTPYTDSVNSLIALISAVDGEAMVSAIKTGGNVTAEFGPQDGIDVVALVDSLAGMPNTFTSWGPLYDLSMKPDISAPGGNIFSTYLNDTFAVLSGTSMATPYVAGVAALYVGVSGGRRKHGARFAKDLAMRIMSSGNLLPWSDGTTKNYNMYASNTQVGTGLIDAFKVVNYTSQLDFVKFALNDTQSFQPHQYVNVTNNGNTSLRYKFHVQDVAGYEALGPYDTGFRRAEIKSFEELVPTRITTRVQLPAEDTLLPGQTKEFAFQFSLPERVNSTALPIYGGNIVITSSKGEELSVPYMGMASDLTRELNEVFTYGYPFGASTFGNYDLISKPYWSFNTCIEADVTCQDYPKLYTHQKWATTELRWDIFEPTWTEEQWTYPPEIGKNGYVGPVAFWSGSSSYNWVNPSVVNVTDSISFPLYDLFRQSLENDYEQYFWLGRLGNGSMIQPGNYSMRFAALKARMDPDKSGSWDLGWMASHPHFEVLPLGS
ncbi:hypothetical protein JX266_013784 [Neoarthrinium moseri]|nr:hypothetical protein JX266_013784 [Neoarthrinium moseri]